MMGYSQTFIPKLKTDHASFTLIACVSTSYQTIVNFEHFTFYSLKVKKQTGVEHIN